MKGKWIVNDKAFIYSNATLEREWKQEINLPSSRESEESKFQRSWNQMYSKNSDTKMHLEKTENYT